MRNILLICMMLLGFSVHAFAQKEIVVTGIVTDTNKEPLIGVNVSIANMPGLGAITDIDGKYLLKIPPYNKLVFTYIGYEPVEVLVKEQRTENVAMEEAKRRLGDRIGYAANMYDALTDADAMIIVTEWQEFKVPKFTFIEKALKEKVIFDGRNIYNPEQMREFGYTYYGIGKNR